MKISHSYGSRTYLIVLSVLGLSADLVKVAEDDEQGKKLQDNELLKRGRQ